MHGWLRQIMGVALTALSFAAVGCAESVYPGEHWETREPAEVGLDADQLARVAEFVGGRGCIVRHGCMVYTWGDAAERGDVASAAKPIYAHFIVRAEESGLIPSFDQPVCEIEPRLADLNADLGHKDREITWRHMAHQTSCYGVRERPGEAFDYNDWHMALLWDTLFLKVYGSSWERVDDEVLHPLLTDVLQCEDDPTFMAFGEDRAGRLGISPRDFARFGLLYLREGLWRETRLLSAEHARMSVTDPVPAEIPQSAGEEAAMIPDQRSMGSRNIPDNQCDHLGSYSWLWWINGVDRDGRRHWPNAPTDSFGAFGHGGPRAMVVFPELDLIISWNDAAIDSTDKENQALGMLVAAVRDTPVTTIEAGPATPRIAVAAAAAPGVRADPERPGCVLRADGGPLFLCGPGDPEDFLYRGALRPDGTRDGDQLALIEKLKGTGANCIYIQAVRSHGGDGDETHNPFVDHDPAKGLSEPVLAQWDAWLSAMDEAGVVAYLFVYDDSARIWNAGDEVGAEERAFLHGLVDRLERHPNLIWCVAEEALEVFSPERVRRIAREIKEADDFDHPVAVHLNHGLDFGEFADDPSIDQFAVQYNVPTAEELHAGLVQAWRETEGRYSLNMSECADHGTGFEMRRRNWACAMAGAYSMVLGMDIAGTDPADLAACGVLVRFMETIDPRGMAPHDELAAGSAEYVLADPGKRGLAYASNAEGPIGIDGMSEGRYDLTWLDCVTGVTVEQHGIGGGPWTRPEGIGAEVVVHAVRADM